MHINWAPIESMLKRLSQAGITRAGVNLSCDDYETNMDLATVRLRGYSGESRVVCIRKIDFSVASLDAVMLAEMEAEFMSVAGRAAAPNGGRGR